MIRHLTLENWRAYERVDLDFEPGDDIRRGIATASGKSSIVEGARFAFFGFVPPSKEGAPRVAATGPTSAAVDVELPSGRVLNVSRAYPARPRGAATPEAVLDGEPLPAENSMRCSSPSTAPRRRSSPGCHAAQQHGVHRGKGSRPPRPPLPACSASTGWSPRSEQATELSQAAKKAADSARKIATVSDDELAQLADVEARATELIAEAERNGWTPSGR